MGKPNLAVLAALACVVALALLSANAGPPASGSPAAPAGSYCPGWGSGLAVEPLSALVSGGSVVVGGETAPATGLPGGGRAAFVASWTMGPGGCNPLWDIVVNTSLNDALVGLAEVRGLVVALARSQTLGGIILEINPDNGSVAAAARIPEMEGYWGGGLAIAPQGLLVIGGGRLVAALNITTLQPLWALELPWPVDGLAASPEGLLLAAGSSHLALISPNGSTIWLAGLGVRGGQLEPKIRGVVWLDGLAVALVEYYEPQSAAGPRAAIALIDPGVPAVVRAWRLAAPWGPDSVPSHLIVAGSNATITLARQDYGAWLLAEIAESGDTRAWLLEGAWKPEPPDAPYSPIPILGAPGLLAVGPTSLGVSSSTLSLEEIDYIILAPQDEETTPVQVSVESVPPSIISHPNLYGASGIAPLPVSGGGEAPPNSTSPATTTYTSPTSSTTTTGGQEGTNSHTATPKPTETRGQTTSSQITNTTRATQPAPAPPPEASSSTSSTLTAAQQHPQAARGPAPEGHTPGRVAGVAALAAGLALLAVAARLSRRPQPRQA